MMGSSRGMNKQSFKNGEELPFDASGGLDAMKNLRLEELNGLTHEEREKVYNELHGVDDIMEETPDFVARKLQEMRDQLGSVPKRRRRALDRAMFLRPGLQSDDKLHLMFLRAEQFDPVRAANKMCRHFEHKRELFGDSCLVKKITLEDLGEAELKVMRSGACQFLTNTDRRGRGIFLTTIALYDLSHGMAFMRYAWYQVMTVIEENEELQKRGVVQISNFYGDLRHSPSELLEYIWKAGHIARDWPFHSCAYHLCYDDERIHKILDSFNLIIGRHLRLRQRFHFGSQLETEYALLTFGIKLSDSLTFGKGFLSRDYLESYIASRREKETPWKSLEHRGESSSFRSYPGPFDVLMGRGRPYREWDGNKKLFDIVALSVDKYADAAKPGVQKMKVAVDIVQQVEADGGKFVQRTLTGWESVPQQVAVDKVSQMLRALIRNSRPPSNQSPDNAWNGLTNNKEADEFASYDLLGASGDCSSCDDDSVTDISREKRLRTD